MYVLGIYLVNADIERHVKELCENNACDLANCILRHPKNCKYYRDYGKCKFNPCVFLRVSQKTKNCSNLFDLLHVAVYIHIKAE